MTTVGLNNIVKNIILNNGEEIELQLFDTAGQEKFRSLSKSYFRNTDAVLFVFAINNKKSFEDIENWVNIFRDNYYLNIPLFLIENKNDLNREVNENLIDDFLEKNKNFRFKSTSASLNNDNSINELFQELGEILYKNYINSMDNTTQKKKFILETKKKKKLPYCCQSDL